MAGAGKTFPSPAARNTALPAGLRWTCLFSLLLLIGLSSLGLFLLAPDWTNIEGGLPVSLRSPLLADYSADPLDKNAFAPLGTAILAEALADRERDQVPDALIATLMDNLRTPVPTVTPRPSLTITPTMAAGATGQPVLPPQDDTPTTTARILSPTARPSATQILSPTPSGVLPTAAEKTPTPITGKPTETLQPTIFHPSATSGTIITPLPSQTPVNTLPPPTRTPVPTTRPSVVPTQPPVPTEDPYPPPPTEETPSYPYP